MLCAHLALPEQLLHQRRRYVRAAPADPFDGRSVGVCPFSSVMTPRNGSPSGVGIERRKGRELHQPLFVPLIGNVESGVPRCGRQAGSALF
jgi:hypothetical protein